MKNKILPLALIVFSFAACKKDPTFNEQLVGNWRSVEVKAGTEDRTGSNVFNLSLQQSLEFDLDLTTTIPLVGQVTQSYTGNWTSDPEKQEVTLNYNGSDESKTWDVTSVTESTLEAETVEGNVRYYVKFQKQ